jgi:hypothetical protein
MITEGCRRLGPAIRAPSEPLELLANDDWRGDVACAGVEDLRLVRERPACGRRGQRRFRSIARGAGAMTGRRSLCGRLRASEIEEASTSTLRSANAVGEADRGRPSSRR